MGSKLDFGWRPEFTQSGITKHPTSRGQQVKTTKNPANGRAHLKVLQPCCESAEEETQTGELTDFDANAVPVGWRLKRSGGLCQANYL